MVEGQNLCWGDDRLLNTPPTTGTLCVNGYRMKSASFQPISDRGMHGTFHRQATISINQSHGSCTNKPFPTTGTLERLSRAKIKFYSLTPRHIYLSLKCLIHPQLVATSPSPLLVAHGLLIVRLPMASIVNKERGELWQRIHERGEKRLFKANYIGGGIANYCPLCAPP